jgi:hypothetical protein
MMSTTQNFKRIASTIGGQSEGERFIRDVRELPVAPDVLAIRIREMISEQCRFAGFCRALQKHIERSVA